MPGRSRPDSDIRQFSSSRQCALDPSPMKWLSDQSVRCLEAIPVSTLFGFLIGILMAGSIVSAAEEGVRRNPSPLKPFSGFRVSKSSSRMVYYHDQTVAVVELGPGRVLLNCELIEVYEPYEKKDTLRNLTRISKPWRIKFDQMMDLMEKCRELHIPKQLINRESRTQNLEVATQEQSANLLSGVLPGTKWCGIGDLAENYFDLGHETSIDKCCRTHDICPAKVRSRTSRYNLTNDSIYTKSHCDCDEQFKKCLRSTDHSTANLMGSIYFNILQVPCLGEIDGKKAFKPATPY